MDISNDWSIYVGDTELKKYHEYGELDHNLRQRTVLIDNDKSIAFTGKQLGYTTWQLSESTERSYETHLYASLYITEQGMYICELVIDQLDIEDVASTGTVCKTHNEIVEFFGLAYQFKLFYEQLSLDKSAYEIHVL